MWSTRFLKAVAVAPACLFSAGLVCLVAAALPPTAAAAFSTFGLMLAGMSAAGRFEPEAIRVLHRARVPVAWEERVLGPAVAMLCHRGLGPPVIRLYVAAGERVSVWACGRRGVVVTRGLVLALSEGRIQDEEVAALMAHAVGVHAAGSGRFDLPIEVSTLPWRLVGVPFLRFGRVLTSLPLLAFAWRLRGVVVAIALVQAAADGRVTGIGPLVVLTLVSYAAPASARAFARRVDDAADRFVVEHDLGPPWAELLRRQPPSARSLERLHAVGLAPPHRAPIRAVR